MRKGMIVMALMLGASMATAQTYLIENTPDGYLNLRAGPGTQYVIITRMAAGDDVEFLEERGNWLRVEIWDGRQGWASERFLDPVVPDGGYDVKVQSTPEGYLNLREGPGTAHEIKLELPTGTPLRIIDKHGNWVRVYGPDVPLGWVYAAYVG